MLNNTCVLNTFMDLDLLWLLFIEGEVNLLKREMISQVTWLSFPWTPSMAFTPLNFSTNRHVPSFSSSFSYRIRREWSREYRPLVLSEKDKREDFILKNSRHLIPMFVCFPCNQGQMLLVFLHVPKSTRETAQWMKIVGYISTLFLVWGFRSCGREKLLVSWKWSFPLQRKVFFSCPSGFFFLKRGKKGGILFTHFLLS